jgi:hypothetical protein
MVDYYPLHSSNHKLPAHEEAQAVQEPEVQVVWNHTVSIRLPLKA